jgi:catechol 2,3-dioxygenase-like lactoylglutathione lyase family enzyme
MEQVGWDGHSKPDPMHARGFRVKPGLPQMNELDEVVHAKARGIDLHSGSAIPDPIAATYDVDGILLPRPFKVTRPGLLHLFVKDVDAATSFYRETMGLVVTEHVTWKQKRCTFLRANTEHHSIGLFPIELRETLGLRNDTTTMSLGLHVATYRQLRDAYTFLTERGVKTVDVPSELCPGIDHAFHVLDPDGHAVTLYFGMQQIGWDGAVRPRESSRYVDPRQWPETIEPQQDAFAGETFFGPLG